MNILLFYMCTSLKLWQWHMQKSYCNIQRTNHFWYKKFVDWRKLDCWSISASFCDITAQRRVTPPTACWHTAACEIDYVDGIPSYVTSSVPLSRSYPQMNTYWEMCGQFSSRMSAYALACVSVFIPLCVRSVRARLCVRANLTFICV